MSRLSAESLSKRYKNLRVVDNVSLTVDSGNVVGLIGPNGAGKTTSFYMIVGLIRADHGHVFLDGQDITHLPIHKRAELGIGYLPQEASIFRHLSVFDNIMAVLENRRDLAKQSLRDTAMQLLEEFRVDHIAKSQGLHLSGGERRRVEIARAVAHQPNFILLDEPFAGVDPISTYDIKKLIRHLADRQIGVFITDHNVREILDICDHSYIVNQGHVIAEGRTEDILRNKTVRNVYLGEDFKLQA